MGFKKSNVYDKIAITLEYTVSEGVTSGSAIVTHHFRLPTTAEREEYQRRLVRMKGRKVVSAASEANLYLWKRCILSVEGYDDLPEGEWRMYFDDDIGRMHVDDAVARFVETYTADEAELEKKSVRSSEQ